MASVDSMMPRSDPLGPDLAGQKRKMDEENALQDSVSSGSRAEQSMGTSSNAEGSEIGSSTDIPESKRRAQNRAAQRAFRERKEKHLKELESRLAELESESRSWKLTNMALRSQLSLLEDELQHYRQPNSRIPVNTSAPGAETAKEPLVSASAGPMNATAPNDINNMNRPVPETSQFNNANQVPTSVASSDMFKQFEASQKLQANPNSTSPLGSTKSSVPTKAEEFCEKLSMACVPAEKPVMAGVPRIASEISEWQSDSLFSQNTSDWLSHNNSIWGSMADPLVGSRGASHHNSRVADSSSLSMAKPLQAQVPQTTQHSQTQQMQSRPAGSNSLGDLLNMNMNMNMNMDLNMDFINDLGLESGSQQSYPSTVADRIPQTNSLQTQEMQTQATIPPGPQGSTINQGNASSTGNQSDIINLDFGNIASGFNGFQFGSGNNLGFQASDAAGVFNNDYSVFDPLDDMLSWDSASNTQSNSLPKTASPSVQVNLNPNAAVLPESHPSSSPAASSANTAEIKMESSSYSSASSVSSVRTPQAHPGIEPIIANSASAPSSLLFPHELGISGMEHINAAKAQIENGRDEKVPVPKQKFVPCSDVWDRICGHPKFGEIDINSMCHELRDKARCSKIGVVLDVQDVDDMLNSFN